MKLTNIFTQYFDIDGSPLDNGKIYIGIVGADIKNDQYQIQLYTDIEKTHPISQPVVTTHGSTVLNGSPVNIYYDDVDVEILIADKSNRTVNQFVAKFSTTGTDTGGGTTTPIDTNTVIVTPNPTDNLATLATIFNNGGNYQLKDGDYPLTATSSHVLTKSVNITGSDKVIFKPTVDGDAIKVTSDSTTVNLNNSFELKGCTFDLSNIKNSQDLPNSSDFAPVDLGAAATSSVISIDGTVVINGVTTKAIDNVSIVDCKFKSADHWQLSHGSDAITINNVNRFTVSNNTFIGIRNTAVKTNGNELVGTININHIINCFHGIVTEIGSNTLIVRDNYIDNTMYGVISNSVTANIIGNVFNGSAIAIYLKGITNPAIVSNNSIGKLTALGSNGLAIITGTNLVGNGFDKKTAIRTDGKTLVSNNTIQNAFIAIDIAGSDNNVNNNIIHASDSGVLSAGVTPNCTLNNNTFSSVTSEYVSTEDINSNDVNKTVLANDKSFVFQSDQFTISNTIVPKYGGGLAVLVKQALTIIGINGISNMWLQQDYIQPKVPVHLDKHIRLKNYSTALPTNLTTSDVGSLIYGTVDVTETVAGVPITTARTGLLVWSGTAWERVSQL